MVILRYYLPVHHLPPHRVAVTVPKQFPLHGHGGIDIVEYQFIIVTSIEMMREFHNLVFHFGQLPVGLRIEILHFEFGKHYRACLRPPERAVTPQRLHRTDVELAGIVVCRLKVPATAPMNIPETACAPCRRSIRAVRAAPDKSIPRR